MKKIAILISIFVSMSACSQDKKVEIAGEKYCVPNSVLLSEPYWIPDETPASTGFAFEGCGEGFDNKRPECNGRNWLIGGTVGDLSGHPGWKWEDGTQGAYFWDVIKDDNAKVDLSGDRHRLVVTTPGTKPTMLVWDKEEALGNTRASLSNGDQLMAVCNRSMEQSKANPYVCNRYMKDNSTSISYSFLTNNLLDHNFVSSDQEVKLFVESLRCVRNK